MLSPESPVPEVVRYYAKHKDFIDKIKLVSSLSELVSIQDELQQRHDTINRICDPDKSEREDVEWRMQIVKQEISWKQHLVQAEINFIRFED